MNTLELVIVESVNNCGENYAILPTKLGSEDIVKYSVPRNANSIEAFYNECKVTKDDVLCWYSKGYSIYRAYTDGSGKIERAGRLDYLSFERYLEETYNDPAYMCYVFKHREYSGVINTFSTEERNVSIWGSYVLKDGILQDLYLNDEDKNNTESDYIPDYIWDMVDNPKNFTESEFFYRLHKWDDEVRSISEDACVTF